MNQIVGAHIRSYRGIVDVVMPLGRTTVLVGANGAGKSSLLEALGLIPSEEGAAGRRFDAPPIVDWFVEPGDSAVMRDCVTAQLPPEVGEAALRHLETHLVVRVGWDGTASVAVNVHAAMNTLRSSDAKKWLRSLEHLAAVAPTATWLSELAKSAAMPSHDRLAFFDLGLALPNAVVARPSVVSMWAEPDDISPMLYRHVNRLLGAWLEPVADAEFTEILRQFAQGHLLPAHQRGLLAPVVKSLSQLASEVVLPFVAGVGRVEVQVLPGPDSVLGEVERLIASSIRDDFHGETPEALRRAQGLLRRFGDSDDLHFDVVMRPPDGSTGAPLDYSRLGTGIRRWVSGAVDEAARLLMAALCHSGVDNDSRLCWVRDSALPPANWLLRHADEQRREAPTVRLIDEPLANLEPRVHRDVVAWMRGRLSVGERLVLSTHNAAALAVSQPRDPVMVIGVHRDAGLVKVHPLGRRLNEELLKTGKRLGVSGPELLFTTRAMVLVEGPHDVALLRACCGSQLAERGVIFSVISGSSTSALSNALFSDLQQMVQLPVWLILDSTKDNRLKATDRFLNRGRSDEVLELTLGRLRSQGVSNVRYVPFEPLDVLAGIKPSILRAAFPNGSVPDDEIALDLLRATENSTEVKNLVLGWCTEGATIPKLGRVVSTVVAHAQRANLNIGNVWMNSTVSQLLTELDQRLK